MILDIRPESRDFRAALRRHIDFPGAADAAPPTLQPAPSSGASEVAPGIPLDVGGVWDRPACVSRFLRQRRIRLVVAWVVAVAVLAAVEWVVVGLFVKWTSGE